MVICPWGFWKSSGYLFAAQKNQAYFLLHLTTALPRSFCLAVNVDTSRMLHFKLFRQSHSPMEFATGWLVKIQGPCNTFQMCSVQRLDLKVASHSSHKCDAGRGPPRSHTKAHNTGDDSLCCTDTVHLQQLIMWKENITILFFSMTEGENFLQRQPCF